MYGWFVAARTERPGCSAAIACLSIFNIVTWASFPFIALAEARRDVFLLVTRVWALTTHLAATVVLRHPDAGGDGGGAVDRR